MFDLKQLKNIFLDYMANHHFQIEPPALFEPVDYILQLGGKRLRPILVLMSYNLFKEDIKPALPIAYAIEIFHNFSLVHDDIMDAALLRRGKPTVHHKYDINTGILSGDVMLIYAYHYILKIKEQDLVPQLLKTFSKVAEQVCIGQQYDMNFETQENVSIDEYLKMIEYKTAVLLVAALKMGAILARTDEKNIYHLGEFGRNIGLAFQLQDDILDTFGNAASFGKRIGGDIIQNKKTYLVLKTLELASEKDQIELNQWLSSYPKDEENKIAAVKALFNKYHILDHANEKKMAYQNQAMFHLDQVKVSHNQKTTLHQLAETLLKRKE
jgi:geranylgeranyl diphosphate synthase type II